MATPMILIVDDDLPFTQFLYELLTAAGYHIIVAKHGAAAFLELEIARPALMLVDVAMPIIDGITFCRMARANATTRDTPIIVMSAVQQPIPVPIAGFLTKPLDIDVLLSLVGSFVDVPNRERQVGAE